MPIDARIALGAQAPQMAQPMELYGNALKLQAMQRQNALAEQEMATAQANQRRQAELLNFMQSAKDPYAEDVQMQLPRFGQPGIDMAAKLQERNRYRAETKVKQAEYEAKTLEAAQAMMPAAVNDPNQYARVIEFVRSRDPAMADRMPPWSKEAVLNLMTTAKDMVAQHRMTANEQSMAEDRGVGRAHAGRTLDETIRHNRAMENIQRQQETRLGASAAAADKNLPGKQQLSTIIDKMRGAYETLRAEGAAVQPGGDVLGNIGARLRGTGVAQAVEGAIGTTAQSERTKIKNMRPLLVNAIKQATGMSAQQMNSNVELKLFLDTATNPDAADIDANLAALENLNALYGLGLDTGAPAAPAGGGRTIVKTGTLNGRKVVQYSDGSTEYAD